MLDRDGILGRPQIVRFRFNLKIGPKTSRKEGDGYNGDGNQTNPGIADRDRRQGFQHAIDESVQGSNLALPLIENGVFVIVVIVVIVVRVLWFTGRVGLVIFVSRLVQSQGHGQVARVFGRSLFHASSTGAGKNDMLFFFFFFV